MKRTIETYGKNGVLDIVGSPQETILYLRDRPIQYSWYAEDGSIWRYHIAQGLSKQAVQLNRGIEATLRRGIQNEGDFLAITEYFNPFFKYGTYKYGYYELFEDLGLIEIPETEEYASFDYYGGCPDVSSTQNFIDEELVASYKEEIQKGSRPVIVLLHMENSWMFHILDGHHKFCAYGRANIKPHAIIITKTGSTYKSIASTVTLARKMGCDNQYYISQMKQEKTKNLSSYKSKSLDLEETFRLIL